MSTSPMFISGLMAHDLYAVYIVIAVYCLGAIVGLFSLLSPFVALLPVCKTIR